AGSQNVPAVSLPVHSSQPLQIGVAARSDLVPWKGLVDDVAYYNQSLIPAQIQAHYQAVNWTGAVLNRGNTSAGSYAIELAGATNVTVSNLSITGAVAGVYAGDGANSLALYVSNADLYGNGKGISLGASNDGVKVVGSTIHASAQDGVHIEASGSFLD